MGWLFMIYLLLLGCSFVCVFQPLNHLKWMLEWFVGNIVWLLVEGNLKCLWHLSWAISSEDGKCWS